VGFPPRTNEIAHAVLTWRSWSPTVNNTLCDIFFRRCQQSEFFHAQKSHISYLLLFFMADAVSAFLIHLDYFMIILAPCFSFNFIEKYFL
jgi:hypothetical protein